MNCTVLDFETYFDEQYSLKRLSIPEYVQMRVFVFTASPFVCPVATHSSASM